MHGYCRPPRRLSVTPSIEYRFAVHKRGLPIPDADETMVSIWKMIGVQVIVADSVMEAGNVYNFNIKLLKVETGEGKT
jgi:hypothetical protein